MARLPWMRRWTPRGNNSTKFGLTHPQSLHAIRPSNIGFVIVRFVNIYVVESVAAVDD